MSFCGLDFGTSNSTIGIYNNHDVEMVMLDDNKNYLRSAIFLNNETKKAMFGEKAIEEYIERTPGRLMTSIKSVLGSTLMDEKTLIFGNLVPFSDILGYFLRNMKEKAEAQLGKSIDSVVMGRPVRFNDKDDKIDQLAEDTLRKIAGREGFKHIEFQFEPIAAAITYAKTVTKEELAVIVDIGGGTSDFTLIKVTPGGKGNDTNILASAGIHIGGTDFDRLLNYHYVMPTFGLHSTVRSVNGSDIEVPTSYYRNLSTWHKINDLYAKATLIDIKRFLAFANDKKLTGRLIKLLDEKEGHNLLQQVENAKKELSDKQQVPLDLSFVEKALQLNLNKPDFETVIANDLGKIKTVINGLLNDSSVKPDQVDAVFFTGGTTRINALQNEVMGLFKNARVVKGDVFNSVAMGLSTDALNRFG
jgi:hypothetical chaperone protein